MDISELRDRIQIRELTAQYNNAIDEGDLGSYLEAFLSDAVFEVDGIPPAKGREEIRALVSAIPRAHVHVTVDPVIHVDGDVATQRSTMLILHRPSDRGEQSVLATGRYHDDLVRTSDGWRFAKRTVELDIDFSVMLSLMTE